MRSIIALCGLKRSGKDVVAKYIEERYGYTHVKIAQPLKDLVRTAFRFTEDDLETDAKDQIHPRWGVSPRVIMNYIGTQVFQYDMADVVPMLKDRCFWIDHVLDTYKNEPSIVISDLRFHHEVKRIREFAQTMECDFTVVRVKRDGTCTGSLASEMESEQLQANITLQNDGTLEDMYNQINKKMFCRTLKAFE